MADYTVQLPKELYEVLERRAELEHKTADMLVAEMVSDQLDIDETAEKAEHDAKTAAFEREIAAFERLRLSLIDEYAGQYVAIYQGQVVAYGNDRLSLVDQVYKQFGPVVCYVGKVTLEPQPIRTVRMPSFRVIRS
jgi:hypothetical protein